MSLAIPEFSDEEIATVQANLDHRWGAGKPALELADVEILFDPDEGEFTPCPAIFSIYIIVWWTGGRCRVQLE